MSTVQTIIDRACRLLGQLNSGESADAQESADSLIALNAMLGSWRNQELMCYAVQDESISLSSGNTNRTIGPSGNLVTTRPVRIEDAYIIYQNISTPIIILNEEEWASISDKTVTSTYPNRIYYKPEMPDGRIYLYPTHHCDFQCLQLKEVSLIGQDIWFVSIDQNRQFSIGANCSCIHLFNHRL